MWMVMHRRLIVCFMAIVIGLAGCGPDLTSPSLVAGTYVARSIDGVPFPWHSNGVRWEADTLVLSPSGTFELVYEASLILTVSFI